MKPASCLLLMLIPLFQLMIPGDAQCSLDAAVDKKIKAALNKLEYKPPALTQKLLCVSVTASGKLASCPAYIAATGCACGYACSSWDVQRENMCHC
ncbi:resistin-like beta [Trichechus manatus latirostris]|uniref:Resistin-like beta n=1 Tax=Trichechus manatus latirostris TaxID=127582 RepID=A0A2Y9DPG6_TRIMA|nr:resistin-like beta [Trichechus manatus latirostris]